MSLATRVIARLDYKRNRGVVKGVRFEGLRRIGGLQRVTGSYQDQGADELLVVDIVASLYEQEPDWGNLRYLVTTTPLTYVGGVRSFEMFRGCLLGFAEKVGMNTALGLEPGLLSDCSRKFGAQAVVLSLELKAVPGGWRRYTGGGRNPMLGDPLDWMAEHGGLAGEVLLSSVDRDGTLSGFDLDMIRAFRARFPETVLVASGGLGTPQHAVEAIQAGADAVATASYLHRGGTIGEIKAVLAQAGVEVR